MDANEHELPVRDPRSVMFEADYWLAVLEELRALNDALRDAAHATASLPLSVLELLLGGDPRPATDKAMSSTHEALDAITRAQAPLDRVIALSAGRIAALRSEAGLES